VAARCRDQLQSVGLQRSARVSRLLRSGCRSPDKGSNQLNNKGIRLGQLRAVQSDWGDLAQTARHLADVWSFLRSDCTARVHHCP